MSKHRSRSFPASPAQRRMYFSSQMRPDSSADTWGIVLTVSGDLKIDRLERALGVLRGRHDALRSTFMEHGGEVLQAVHKAEGGAAEPALIDLVEAEGDAQDGRREWADAEARRLLDIPFDIAAGPLWRTSVIRISPQLHLVTFVFHHIIIDDLSVQIFAEELRHAYADPSAPALATPAAQYADFCRSENGLATAEEDLNYWRGQLAGTQRTPLPEDGSKSPGTTAGSRLPVPIPDSLSAEFEAFCKARSITPFIGMLAVYFVLLQRWSGARDISVGTQVVSRPNSALFETIGFFSNTLVLRCQVAPTATFDHLIGLVRETVHDAIDYQDVPFDTVVDALAPERDGDRNPLFQAAISYGSLDPCDLWALDGLQVSPMPESTELTDLQFDLTLDIQRLAGKAAVTVEYRRERFSDAAMRQFARAYGNLLGALIADPGAPLGSIPLLDRAALAKTLMLGSSDGVQDGEFSEKCTSAWELFEITAAATPEREAVNAAGERLTFAELADRARMMATGLQARGVGAGSMVGICLTRRSDLIAAMLATWCAGGAFLLLDPQQPVARRRLLLEEAGIGLIVADEGFAAVETVSVHALLADGVKSMAAKEFVVDATPFASRPAAAPAYVVFTSGSTGLPKGVVVDQESLVALATTQLAPMYARLPDRQLNVAALSSLTFDVFINQCLGMIAFGHRLMLIDETERVDPLRFLARGSDSESAIDVLDCNSSQMEMLVDAGLLDLPYPPKMVLIGGESASDRLWRRLHDQPGLLAYNMYGLTECTVDSAMAVVGEHVQQVAGRAAGTTRIYIVDDQLQLLPPMFVGEICIGGLGVAQGYVGQPAYTSERFVADPFGGAPGKRMYRTGDRGRLRPDGQLEFWGRIDDQFKVRGQRIEPGEVEAALIRHPDVARAAVVATAAGTHMAQLVAYVVPRSDVEDVTPTSVRESLRGRLPISLLPDRVEVLDAFPVTANGKVDRRALSGIRPSPPEPDVDNGIPDSVDSRTRELCDIVAEVVGVPHVNLDDNFFDIGGNSLLAMMLTGRVRTDLGCDLGLRDIFEMQSIGDIAARLHADDQVPRPLTSSGDVS
ncbi:amino acid adenylation domain-containing protein [Streptomyces gelaticus]|uniref:amino acid adenylation domain-containing protein n=1 Tax=Streptomyces gelaticus TaxID=285446 RepID=UPI00379FC210